MAPDSGIPGRLAPNSSRELYLDLLKRALTRDAFPDRYFPVLPYRGTWKFRVNASIQRALHLRGLTLVHDGRSSGPDWVTSAESMIGMSRMDHLHAAIENLLKNDVPGGLFDAGVWRGGSSIFMRGALQAYGDGERSVWVADSFQGPPPPTDPKEGSFDFHRQPAYAASLDEVKANFRRYGLLDERVRFLIGWFKDTLPTVPPLQFALLRISADLYASTRLALEHLYGRLSQEGFVIVDGYQSVDSVTRAVDDFRAAHAISTPIRDREIDVACWNREP